MTMSTALRNPEIEVAREMLHFLVRWAPFGGGDEEILPTFGVLPSTFYSRTRGMLKEYPYLIPGHDVEPLITYCSHKLWAAGAGR